MEIVDSRTLPDGSKINFGPFNKRGRREWEIPGENVATTYTGETIKNESLNSCAARAYRIMVTKDPTESIQ